MGFDDAKCYDVGRISTDEEKARRLLAKVNRESAIRNAEIPASPLQKGNRQGADGPRTINPAAIGQLLRTFRKSLRKPENYC